MHLKIAMMGKGKRGEKGAHGQTAQKIGACAIYPTCIALVVNVLLTVCQVLITHWASFCCCMCCVLIGSAKALMVIALKQAVSHGIYQILQALS